MTAHSQIELLADYIVEEIPHEPREGGAGEAAVRIMRLYRQAFKDIANELNAGILGAEYSTSVINVYAIAKMVYEETSR